MFYLNEHSISISPISHMAIFLYLTTQHKDLDIDMSFVVVMNEEHIIIWCEFYMSYYFRFEILKFVAVIKAWIAPKVFVYKR